MTRMKLIKSDPKIIKTVVSQGRIFQHMRIDDTDCILLTSFTEERVISTPVLLGDGGIDLLKKLLGQ